MPHLTARNCRPEDIGVVAVVIPELEFGDVQRQIFAADLMEASHNAALQQRPENINRLSMHNAVNITASGMPNELMIEISSKPVIAGMAIVYEAERAKLGRPGSDARVVAVRRMAP